MVIVSQGTESLAPVCVADQIWLTQCMFECAQASRPRVDERENHFSNWTDTSQYTPKYFWGVVWFYNFKLVKLTTPNTDPSTHTNTLHHPAVSGRH